jgi:hypothetical protein
MSAVFEFIPVPSGDTEMSSLFGNGSDGVLTYDGVTTILGVVPSDNVYTLTRSVFASTLTVNNGVVIVTNGYALRCSGVFTNNGTIQFNGAAGGAGGTGTSNAGGSGALAPEGAGPDPSDVPISTNPAYFNLRSAGSGSTNSNGGAGYSVSQDTLPNVAIGSSGGNSGAGGNGSSHAGGTAGSATSSMTYVPWGTVFNPIPEQNPTPLGGYGAGGGGGSGDGTHGGGGGGSGGNSGGMVYIAAQTLANNGTIEALGGQGGNGGNGYASGNCGGGGAGGGGAGGIVQLVYVSLTLGTVSVAGGSPGSIGTGSGTGANGNAGTAGSAGVILKYNTSLGIYQ